MRDAFWLAPLRRTGAYLGVALVMLLTACGGGDEAADEPPPTATPSPVVVEESVADAAATEAPFDGPVSQIRIPRFDVVSDIEAIGLIPGQNQMDVPKDPHNTGWYDIYDHPGFGGNAIFSAHVDYYPDIRGPFYQLTELEDGDDVVIVMEDGSEYRYRVFSNVRYHVSEIPTGDLIEAADKPEGEEWITLITCGGELIRYNGDDGPGAYQHRDVVLAVRYQ